MLDYFIVEFTTKIKIDLLVLKSLNTFGFYGVSSNISIFCTAVSVLIFYLSLNVTKMFVSRKKEIIELIFFGNERITPLYNVTLLLHANLNYVFKIDCRFTGIWWKINVLRNTKKMCKTCYITFHFDFKWYSNKNDL